MADFLPSGIEKINISQFLTFLDTTSSSSYTWKVLDVGITDYGIDYKIIEEF